MEKRSYRYFEGEVLYPFGHGLSYTTFRYNNLILERDEIARDESLVVSVDVTNSGNVDGEEVVQLYFRDVESEVKRPLKELRGFERVFVKAGQTIAVTMTLSPDDLAYYDQSAGDYMVEPGQYEILVGPSSEDSRLLRTSLVVK
jgi:beta-glucosidase